MAQLNLNDLPVSELKRKIATEPDLGNVMRFFLDKFASSDAFLRASRPTVVPEELVEGMRPVIAKLFSNRDVGTKWSLAELPLMGLVHGTVRVEKKSFMLVWARDLSTGVLAIEIKAPGEMLFARISVTPQPAAAN